MAEKRLLREWYAVDYKPALLKEDREKNGGKLILSGIIQKAETKNQNKRVYPREVLRREIENYTKAVRENRAVGELDHPESSTVALKNASHMVREMWWDGDTVMGKVEVLTNTPNGKILESLLESGVCVGISSRGVGSTERTMEGADMVQPDYQIICFDIVSEPSTPGAYLFSEGKSLDLDVKYGKADRIYRALNDIIVK
ncbi:MAG: primosomal protein [Acidiferrobacterales bacterium]